MLRGSPGLCSFTRGAPCPVPWSWAAASGDRGEGMLGVTALCCHPFLHLDFQVLLHTLTHTLHSASMIHSPRQSLSHALMLIHIHTHTHAESQPPAHSYTYLHTHTQSHTDLHILSLFLSHTHLFAPRTCRWMSCFEHLTNVCRLSHEKEELGSHVVLPRGNILKGE